MDRFAALRRRLNRALTTFRVLVPSQSLKQSALPLSSAPPRLVPHQGGRANHHRGDRCRLSWPFLLGIVLGLLLVGLSPSWAQTPLDKLPPSPAAESSDADAATSPEETTPLSPQEPLERALVTLDGRKLFTVAGRGSQAAQVRAERITAALQGYVSQSPLPKITTRTTDTGATVLVGETTLIQVTPEDGQLANSAPVAPRALARRWATDIRQALEAAQEQRTPESRYRSLSIASLVLGAATAVYWWTRRFQERIASHLFEQIRDLISGKASDPSLPQIVNVLAGLGLILARLGLVVAAVIYAINRFPTISGPTYTIARRTVNAFVAPIFPLGDNDYSIVDLLILMVALVGVVIAARVVSNLLRSRVLRVTGLSSGSQAAIATLSRYSFIALGSLVLLQVWGLDLSSLTLLASALGFGIGFGLQNIARDFSSGLVLLFERPLQVGDFLEVGEFVGTVNHIGARSTHIKTLDQISVIVPNSYFLENQVINWSHENPLSRISIPVGVAYSSDPELVRQVLLEAGKTQASVVKMPPPQVFFKGFGDSALSFELLVWIMEPHRHPTIKSDLYFAIFKRLADQGIEIPFPQRDLHIRTGTASTNLESPDGMRPRLPMAEEDRRK
ncbi:MAG: mechanosensitive ion channel domain-containing protein [Cyanobacteria bacterium P01_A01_bin.135]